MGGIGSSSLPTNDVIYALGDFVSPLIGHVLVRPVKCVEIKQEGCIRFFVAFQRYVIIILSAPPPKIKDVMLADCST